MEFLAVGIGLYALSRLIGEASSDDVVEDTPVYPDNPVVPLTPTDPAYKIEEVYSNGGRTLFCLYQLEGGLYQEPDSGLVIDETNYVKVGHIVGDPLGTNFQTESGSGGYSFSLDGTDYTNVSIYTLESGKAYIDSKANPEEDPTSPQKPDEPAPSSPSKPAPPTLGGVGMNAGSMRRGGVY